MPCPLGYSPIWKAERESNPHTTLVKRNRTSSAPQGRVTQNLQLSGDRGRNRTYDLRRVIPALFQLSYATMTFAVHRQAEPVPKEQIGRGPATLTGVLPALTSPPRTWWAMRESNPRLLDVSQTF